MGAQLGGPELQELCHPLPSPPRRWRRPTTPTHEPRLYSLHDQVSHDANCGHHIGLLDLVRQDTEFLEEVLHEAYQQQTGGDYRLKPRISPALFWPDPSYRLKAGSKEFLPSLVAPGFLARHTLLQAPFSTNSTGSGKASVPGVKEREGPTARGVCLCGPTSLALAPILGLYPFMTVNNLCKIFVRIFVFKYYRIRVFFFFLKMFNYLGRFKHLGAFLTCCFLRTVEEVTQSTFDECFALCPHPCYGSMGLALALRAVTGAASPGSIPSASSAPPLSCLQWEILRCRTP